MPEEGLQACNGKVAAILNDDRHSGAWIGEMTDGTFDVFLDPRVKVISVAHVRTAFFTFSFNN